MSRRRQVFLGSSQEAAGHADLVSSWLEEVDLIPLQWDEPSAFEPGASLLSDLLSKARSDVIAAVFIFAEDDLIGVQSVPRGNVLLEYGLFAGALGEERVIAVVVGHPKAPTDLGGIIYVDLNKKYRAKQALQSWARKLRTRPKEDTGKLFETYVDAALCTEERTQIARTAILDHARDDDLLPGRYLYDNEVGTDHWVSLCKDLKYNYFHRGLRYWGEEAAGFVEVIEGLIGDEFDFISLGPGDGQKDLEIIRAWVKRDLDVIYYPYDVSLRMIACAVRSVRKLRAPVRLRAVLADFEDLSKIDTVFASRDAPNVISLLGNSLGNIADELTFVRNLRALMKPNDLLLLEVRLKGAGGGPSEASHPKAKRFYFSPLEHYLAVSYDANKVKSREDDRGLSKIPGAESTLIYYEDFEFEGETFSDTKLLCITEYGQDDFIDAIEKVGFECILPKIDDSGSFLVCLMKPV